MKTQILISFISISTILLMPCGDDGSKSPKIDFKNQSLQGVVNKTPWQFVTGTAEISPFDAGKLSIDMTAEAVTDPCNTFFFEGLRVFFSVTNEVGLYEFALDFNNPDASQTITLYDPDGSLNTIITEGALEILTITSTEVTGRIDGRYDDDNYVNGDFTVPFCE
ncbi:MAG: hypothetical protein O2887_17150 [Bacteroidetes bacterium]|nr:hypothetical protein [Bacteroidota bacterium]MDA1122188.1 hypothetical protein [Bacteroidota bacterium]